MSHTPGPWKVAENLFGNTASYEVYANVETKSGKGGYTRICQITPRDQKDNAALIAAAPKMLGKIKRLEAEKAVMLEVLETAKQFISNGIELGYIHLPEEGDSALETPAIIEAAIRKARGEE